VARKIIRKGDPDLPLDNAPTHGHESHNVPKETGVSQKTDRNSHFIRPQAGLYCLVRSVLYEQLTDYWSDIPVRIHGISSDLTETLQGAGKPFYSLEIPPGRQELASRLIELLASWPADQVPKNPIIVDLSPTGDLVVTVSTVKRLRHS
jgi:hypothetical protein